MNYCNKTGTGDRINIMSGHPLISTGTFRRLRRTRQSEQILRAKLLLRAITVSITTGGAVAPVAAEAACELYPQFTPASGRTSNEAWEADRFVDSVGVNLR